MVFPNEGEAWKAGWASCDSARILHRDYIRKMFQSEIIVTVYKKVRMCEARNKFLVGNLLL
ncbi:MAG: hypothetical protein EBS11_02135 [Janthinobacterium sp.]|nr:hypothetical protein [Janthinobacterium sp.]